MKILGISHEHDSGVAFIDDGKIIYAANEERFNHEKFTMDMPVKSITKGEMANPGFLKDIDTVVVGSKIHISKNLLLGADRKTFWQQLSLVFSYINLDRFLFGTKFGIEFTILLLKIFQWKRTPTLKHLFSSLNKRISPKYIDHHLAHAASAYYTAPWTRCLVITLDSQGDGFCSKIYMGNDGKLQLLHSIPFFHSPGSYYQYINLILGFKPGQEGKVTGLAAYGNYEKTLPIFQSRIIFDKEKISFRNMGFYRYREIDYLKKKLRGFSKEDISAGIQKHLENLVTGYIEKAINEFVGLRIPVALAGGVFANVKLNQKIAELKEVSEIYIFPHMGDGGLAIGSAFAYLSEKMNLFPSVFKNLYLGPEINKIDNEEVSVEQISKEIAGFLASGKIIAIARGRMEYGPRALGNRSILASAKNNDINKNLNQKLRRSVFMPFAPVIRKEKADEYFIGWQKCEKALEFMTITLTAKDKFRSEAPAALHIDGTARPQIISKETNPLLYGILIEYEKITGSGVLINTSFNIHDEPIICAEEEARVAFQNAQIDLLLLGDSLIKL